MASDPERPIEKLLRACGEKRREDAGAPLELHPATRRLLQGEAARQFAKPAAEPRPAGGSFRQWWPRLAWSLGGVAALAALVLVLIPPRAEKSELLAKNEFYFRREHAAEAPTSVPADRDSAKSLAQSVATPAPSAQPPPQLAGRTDNLKQQAAMEAVNAPAVASTTPMSKASLDSASAPSVAARELAKPTDNAAPPALSLAAVDQSRRYGLRAPTEAPAEQVAKDTAATERLRFIQTETKAKAALTDRTSSPATVLSSFQIEQTDTGLRIIDGDGSVYTGSLQAMDGGAASYRATAQSAATARAPRLAEAKGFAPIAPPDSQRAQTWSTYFFRVVGTNRTLNQRIVFTGNLVCPANFPMPKTDASSSTGGVVAGGPVGARMTNGLPLLNSRISGKVLLDDRRELEINALPAKQ